MSSPTLPPTWPELVSAWTSIIGVGLLLLAGGIAWYQAVEARRLRRAQARPFVIIDIEAAQTPLFDLVIWNSGATMARNVRFRFSPQIASTMDSDTRGIPALKDLPIFTSGIPSLPPGKKIRMLFDNGPPRKQSDLPDTYHVSIEYEGEEVRRLLRRTKRERLVDETTLDLGIYWGVAHIERKGIHEVQKTLVEIEKTLKKWSASGGSGILTLTPDMARQRTQEWLLAVHLQKAKEEASPETRPHADD